MNLCCKGASYTVKNEEHHRISITMITGCYYNAPLFNGVQDVVYRKSRKEEKSRPVHLSRGGGGGGFFFTKGNGWALSELPCTMPEKCYWILLSCMQEAGTSRTTITGVIAPRFSNSSEFFHVQVTMYFIDSFCMGMIIKETGGLRGP
jgi:hypothetical protein